MLKKFVFRSLLLSAVSCMSCIVASQPETAVAAFTQTPFSPIAYPQSWNEYKVQDMFPLLEKQETVQGIHEWLSGIYACFKDFDSDEKFGVINYVRTLHNLATKVKHNRGMINALTINSFLKEWYSSAGKWLSYFDSQNLSILCGPLRH